MCGVYAQRERSAPPRSPSRLRCEFEPIRFSMERLHSDSRVLVPLDDPSLAIRGARNNSGGNGKNCGVINVTLFAKSTDAWSGKPLFQLAAQQALQHPEFVERWAAHGLFSGKRSRGGSASAKMVAAHIAAGNKVTNLTLALIAKAIGEDIYVVNHVNTEKKRMACVTKYAHERVLDAKTSIGAPVSMAELREDFSRYRGPVLLFKQWGHWSAYPLREDPTAQAGSSEERPRRFCGAYR